MNTDWSLFGKKEQGQIIGGRKETKMKKKKKKDAWLPKDSVPTIPFLFKPVRVF